MKDGEDMAEQHQAQDQHEQTAEELHELKRIRREKLAELQAAGKDPFQQVRFERDHYTTDIHEHFDGEIKLDDIAAAACLSKFHFIRLFKASYNMTVWDYININRVDAAINLLSTTSDSVINIALKCGYGSPANFNRIFKKITSTTPKDYRKHLRQKSDG